MTHELKTGDRYEGTHGHVWRIDAFGVEKDIFQQTRECIEVSCDETRDRSWIPSDQFVESLNDPESSINLITRVGECEGCGQQKIIHSEEEVML